MRLSRLISEFPEVRLRGRAPGPALTLLILAQRRPVPSGAEIQPLPSLRPPTRKTQILEAEMNPFTVFGSGGVALDARVRVAGGAQGNETFGGGEA